MSTKLSCGGSIRQRSNGSWEGRITLSGKSFSVTEKTKKACEKEIRKLVELNKKGVINKRSFPLREYMLYWLEQTKFTVEPTTYQRRQRYIEKEIFLASFVDKDLGDITAEEIQEYINSLVGMNNLKHRRYPIVTIRHIFCVFRQVYQYAYEANVIVYNPVNNVKMPKKDLCVQPRQSFSYTSEEIQMIRSACLAKDENGNYIKRYGLVILLLLNTGMRMNEALALCWSDIRNGFIYVNKSLQRLPDIRVAPTKTAKSTRAIPINHEIQFVLDELKRVNIPSHIVCCNSRGEYLSQNTLNSAFKSIIRSSGVQSGGWIHLLRHTFGSELLKKGVSISDVSRLMGHSSIDITYSTYIHIEDEHLLKVMNNHSVS